MVEIFKAVTNPTRQQIVNILISGECNVGELANTMGKKQPITSVQLSILKHAGVLNSRRNNNKVYYSPASDSIKKIVESIIVEL